MSVADCPVFLRLARIAPRIRQFLAIILIDIHDFVFSCSIACSVVATNHADIMIVEIVTFFLGRKNLINLDGFMRYDINLKSTMIFKLHDCNSIPYQED